MKENNLKKSFVIRDTLLKLGVIKDENVEIFSKNTRDRDNIIVYRDNKSKVIFIDEHYVGNDEYQSGQYREDINNGNLEDVLDVKRRWENYKHFAIDKNIVDYGCGNGNFLRVANDYVKSLYGIEIQKDYNKQINQSGIECLFNMNTIKDIDTFFLFHCLEHLPDPLDTLKQIHAKLIDGGNIIIEVPHAKDFLIDQLDSFKDFTLWSQHLVLHTRESLNLLLLEAGFRNIHITGVQRYGLANHLEWLKNNKPGGHTKPLSIIETDNLKNAYADALSKLDANDTLIAIATT